MKKAIKINLNSIAFHIDEDAYELLDEYLNSVKLHFRDIQGSQNIIEDIEVRISELFQSKINESKQVITIQDVRQIMDTLGRPADFDGPGEEDEETKESGTYIYKKSKRLYRDHENALLGGVGAGVGAFLNMEPVWPRLAFVILFFASGFGAILYIILWIVVPPARTTAEKLEMRGESITLENIEKSMTEEYKKVRKNVDDFRSSERYKSFTNGLANVVNALGKILLALLKIAGLIVGILLIIAGIVALMGITGLVFFDFDLVSNLLDFHWPLFSDKLQTHLHSKDVTLLLITLFLAVGIPLMALIYTAVKTIFQIKVNDKALGMGVFVLWLLSVLFVGYSLFIEKGDVNSMGYQGIEGDMVQTDARFLYLQGNEALDPPMRFLRFFWSGEEYGYRPNDNVKDIFYGYQIRDSILVLDPFF